MKNKLMTLFAVLVLTLAFSVTCFAKESPTARVIPDEEESTNDNGGNRSPQSPQTGFDLTLGFVAVITAGGVALISKKKFSEAE